jgi:hypothetical protein
LTSDDFIDAFATPSDTREAEADRHDPLFRGVREQLRGLGEEQRFEVLFRVAVMDQDDAPASAAAILLRELSPNCPISCEEAVRAMLESWDTSLEEIPFYLAARFGSALIRKTVRSIEQNKIIDARRQRLRTVDYWMDCYDAAYGASKAKEPDGR